MAVDGYIDDQVKPPTVVQEVGVCAAPETALHELGDSVVDVVLDAVRVVVDERVVVVVEDTVVSAPEADEGNSKPASRAQVPTSSPSRQQNPGTGAHHVPASQ